MNQIRVLFFATISDIIRAREIILDIPESATIKTLLNHLEDKYPALSEYESRMLISINQEFIPSDDREIPYKAEVAIFPPVSGG